MSEMSPKARILVVDDDRFFLELCCDILHAEGYEVDAADSGEKALRLFAARTYHLVITDLFMPGMSGLDFLGKVKAASPATEVIMVTGHGNVETAIYSLKNGARDYLIKPFNADEFRHTVTVCLEQRRLVDENSSLKDLVQLFQLGQSIASCIDVERLYPLITESMAKEVGATRALGIFRHDEEGLVLMDARGVPAETAETLSFLILAEHLDKVDYGAGHHFIDFRSDGLPEIFADLHLEEALALFIRTRAVLQGVVILFNNDAERLPAVTDFQRFNFLLDQSSLAIDNALRYFSAKSLIYIDELTGIFNYRYLDVALEREIKRVERYGSSVSVMFLDMDEFKGVNDVHGHLVGSRLLKEVGGLLKKSVREVDVVIRYGGDEFTVILSETTDQEAALVAERIRRMIQDQCFLQDDGLCIRVTASIGYACYPDDTSSKLDLLQLADSAMYKSKEGGRNRVFRALPKRPRG